MRPWFERYEGRLEAELEAIRLRFDDVVVEAQPPDDDRLVVSFTAYSDDRAVRLRVEYPDSFPHLRPYVFAPEEQFSRHQHPSDKNLCLIDRSTRAWRPSQTAADHIAEQLPKLLAILDLPAEERSKIEVPQGEPASAFLVYENGGIVLLPAPMLELPADAARGSGTIRALRTFPIRAGAVLRGAVIELTHERGGQHDVVATADELLESLVEAPNIRFRWVRVELGPETFPRGGSAEGLLELAHETAGPWINPTFRDVPGGRIAVTGIVFRDEVRLTEFEDSWVFVVTLPQLGSPSVSYTARAERFVQEDAIARVASLAPLAGTTVALVGLGALGAPVAIELARAQVGTLRILDFDWHEFGASVRWPFGLEAAAWSKTQFLGEFLARHFPFTKVEQIAYQLGSLRGTGPESESDVVDRLLNGADLIVDGSAEIGINHLLSDLTEELGIPQVYVWSTEGGWGGVVSRVIPGSTGCWFCLKLHLEDRDPMEPPPLDPDEARARVQPRGCAAHTYVAAGFDLTPLTAQTARLAAQTLLRGEDGYPDSAQDVMILALRTPGGEPITPSWHGHPLEPHPRCQRCGNR